ncbi:MAG: NAD(P)H-dependent oxidoreductase [Bacteroidaceae bacterium]|nr:NAD(P)H-dependent oxidoreductase [Bacteroidaceae bacterium]
MKKLFMMLMAGMLVTACASKPKAEEAEEPAKKVLVLYYSVTNTTKQIAEYIQQKTGADIEAIQTVEELPTDYQELLQLSGKMRESNTLPELKPLAHNVADYDLIFFGYPIWFGTYAQPVKTLVASGVLSGKTVVPFCTSGSSGVKESAENLKKDVPNINIPESFNVRASLMDKMPATVDRVLISLGLMEGENEVLADYSAQQAPTADETAIFDAAISTYPMMKGAKVISAGSRTTSKGTDYKFVAEGGMGGTMDVYVTKENGDVAPYFTAVDR